MVQIENHLKMTAPQHLCDCKLGDADATVAAHVETLHAKVLISENHDFLTEIKRLPFQVLRAEEALPELGAES
jgi:hypothetical protein